MGVDIETYRGRIGTFKFLIGVDVVTVQCTVNFSGSMKVVGCVGFIGLLLLIAGIESNPGPTNTEREALNEDRRKIFVTGIPQGVDMEYLHLFFKNPKKQGGGKISNIIFDEENMSAEIMFEEEEAVQIILQKRPIKIKENMVEITPVREDMSSVCSKCTIEVTGIQMDDSARELLELYFDDEESSGGEDVTDIRIMEDGKALVTFASADVAQRVINRKNHTLQSKPLRVVPHQESEKFVTCYDSSTVSMEISSAQLDSMNKENCPGISVDAVRIEMTETVDKPEVNTQNLLPGALTTVNTQDLFPGAMTTIYTRELFPGSMTTVKTQDLFPGAMTTVNTQDLFPGAMTTLYTRDLFPGSMTTKSIHVFYEITLKCIWIFSNLFYFN